MLARLFQAKVTLLHVIDINDPAWAKYSGTSVDFMRHLRAKAQQHMQEAANLFRNEAVEMEPLIVEGLPSEEIIGAVEPSCLLLLGLPIRKPFWRMFSKRTSEQLLRRARCALMLCRN